MLNPVFTDAQDVIRDGDRGGKSAAKLLEVVSVGDP